jgi:DNA-binding transcriptional MerR regulator
MDWSIQQIARLAGTTSRTLRHYGDLGLLEPTRIGANGYRYYDQAALTRLQRILLLRELGLALPAIAEILDDRRDHADALEHHLRWLRDEQQRLDRQVRSVETTITKLRKGEPLMADEMFDGFDHTAHKDEVVERWGAEAYRSGADWWTAKSADEKAEFTRGQQALAADWADAANRGLDPSGPEAQQLAARQYDWLAAIPGTPRDAGGPTAEYFAGLGDLYVADDRFAANYGGTAGAEFVRDAIQAYAVHNL